MTDIFLYNKYKPLAVYKTGSSVLPIDSNDEDYVLFFENDEQVKKARKHYIYIENITILFRNKTPQLMLTSYMYKYMEYKQGEDIKTLRDFNILNYISEYKEILKRNYYRLIKVEDTKEWYKLFIGAYIIKNNSYELSEEQWNMVNKAHNIELTQEDKDMIKDLII